MEVEMQRSPMWRRVKQILANPDLRNHTTRDLDFR